MPLTPVVVTESVSSPLSEAVHDPVTKRQRYCKLAKAFFLLKPKTNLMDSFTVCQVGGADRGPRHNSLFTDATGVNRGKRTAISLAVQLRLR
jgi:hypothetical protein